jgi:mannose-1-phosphate guanylyltransferase
MHQTQDDRWALILAGGDPMPGPFTHTAPCAERPFAGETLLEQTLQRVACVVPPERTSVVVTRRQQALYAGDADKPGRLIVQPAHRGTAPAALYGLLSIRGRDPGANIAIFPSHPFFRNEIAFMMRVRSAFRAVERTPGLIILLGIVPDKPSTDYGWIQPGDRLPGVAETSLLRVERFWEKPSRRRAETLAARGCLWNSLVVVGSAAALLVMLREAVPFLFRAFEPVRPLIGTAEEKEAMERVYANLVPMNFYTEVLAVSRQALTVLPVSEAGWTGAARPGRTLSLVAGGQRSSRAGG